ncbi:hypothetical protein ACFE04_015106 [Oxalis oulophora]
MKTNSVRSSLIEKLANGALPKLTALSQWLLNECELLVVDGEGWQSGSCWAEDGERLGRGRSASGHRKSGWEEESLTDRGWAGNKIVVRGRKWDSESGGSQGQRSKRAGRA